MSRTDLTLVCTLFAVVSDSILLIANAESCAVDDVPTFTCPPSHSQKEKTVCCLVNGTASCCTPGGGGSVSDSLVIMISILVMLLCICLSVLCIVCCFWSPCPLYSMCRINYTYGDIVAYSKEEESALSLPPDESYLSNTYSPLPIKVIKVSEDL